MLSIGAKIWVFDGNHRVYQYPDGTKSSGPIYRYYFLPMVIAEETPRSWVARRLDSEGKPYAWGEGVKIPKNHAEDMFHVKSKYGGTTYYLNEKVVEDTIYMNENRYRISEVVQRINDADLMRKVAELIGYQAK